jgi:hypothetical protein
MAICTYEWFAKAFANEQGGEVVGDTFAIDYLSDTIKAALLTASASPNLDTWETWADVTNECGGTGYAAGGQALASKTLTVTPANSWATARANGTPYAVGDIVRPATPNGYLYRCVVAGTSGGSVPTFSTTIGRETADGATLVWSTLGKAIVTWDAADPSWPTTTLAAAARYLVIYKDTGTANTSPVFVLGTFDADVPCSGGTFLVTLPSNGFGYKVRA